MGYFQVQSHSNTQKYTLIKINSHDEHYKKQIRDLRLFINNTVINYYKLRYIFLIIHSIFHFLHYPKTKLVCTKNQALLFRPTEKKKKEHAEHEF